jgi:RHH-type rel operon transcriptional repressor/antitoxin RelB
MRWNALWAYGGVVDGPCGERGRELERMVASLVYIVIQLMEEDDMSVAVSVRIPPALARRLDAIARESERSRSFVIQKALEAYLEDYADLQVALDRLRDTTDPVVSGAELRKAIGL